MDKTEIIETIFKPMVRLLDATKKPYLFISILGSEFDAEGKPVDGIAVSSNVADMKIYCNLLVYAASAYAEQATFPERILLAKALNHAAYKIKKEAVDDNTDATSETGQLQSEEN